MAAIFNLIRARAHARFFCVMKVMEIHCTACGQTALVRAEPVYDGFKKTGEAFICTACGKRYASAAETPFAARAPSRPAVFTEADKPRAPSIFSDDERQRSCGWCSHFVVNPFSQRCGLTNRETQATDLCVRFEKKPEPSDAKPSPDSKPATPLS